VYPGMSERMIDYIAAKIKEFIGSRV